MDRYGIRTKKIDVPKMQKVLCIFELRQALDLNVMMDLIAISRIIMTMGGHSEKQLLQLHKAVY